MLIKSSKVQFTTVVPLNQCWHNNNSENGYQTATGPHRIDYVLYKLRQGHKSRALLTQLLRHTNV